MTVLPSPASSPSVTPTDLTSPPSRKRQRSQSMHSDSDASSSSIKRSVADTNSQDAAVRSPRADKLSTLTLTDSNHDIDSYMAQQGEADIPATITFTQPAENGFLAVLPAEKFAMAERTKNRRMEVGETWYLVSRVWWRRWRKACTGEIDKEGPVSEQDLGPVDNSSLLDSYGNLQQSLAEGVDLEFVPEEVWNLLVAWYGQPRCPLPRQVIARGAAKQASIELRPPRLRVLRMVSNSTLVQLDSDGIVTVISSAGETIDNLSKRLATAVAPDEQVQAEYRIWRLNELDETWSALEIPASVIHQAEAKILEHSTMTLQDEGIESGDALVVEFKQANGWIMDDDTPPPLEAAPPPSQRTNTPTPLFNSNDGFFNRMNRSLSSTSAPSITRDADTFYDNVRTVNGTWKTVGTRKEKTVEPGTLGLGNMGNTCFMNSALQCLAHNEELTDYFLTGLYQEELNPDNPLGMHGAIAEAFGALLQRIWTPTGPSTSYSPREFKTQLQRFAPQFSGYQQHDSQELVAFLLDGLHEDLNRVLKKPYVEKPDWEGGGDLELVDLARRSWEGYMMRNDSVIVDLFQGQYQSTLVCPECEKVSITFDPFMYLTLPIPVKKTWRHDIYYVPWDIEKPHVKVPVEISKDATFKELRALLGRWMSADPENLLTLEIFSHRIYKNLNDGVLCGEMNENDTIVCFELPCISQQSRVYKRQPDDSFIVPVFLCDSVVQRNNYLSRGSQSLFGYPTVVAIDQEQAKDPNAIYDAVVARLERWTANARDLYTWEADSGSDIDGIPVKLNGYPSVDSIIEIKENGDVVTVQEAAIPEGDIVDEKDMVIVGEEDMDTSSVSLTPRKVCTKKDIFSLRLQANHKDFGAGPYNNYQSGNRWESWERRKEGSDKPQVLLREGDAFYCEFDENMKAYYFGEERSRWEHALWDRWEEYIHPEYIEMQKAASEKKTKGLSLQDCLDEFTKEEKLGEDDLWYCPRCKKHQQATKRFDLWKAPDILVVHLKRFSNSRMLRDKIDTFIDFPIEGLDLSEMVGERAVATRLAAQDVDVAGLQLTSVDEPLVYDLFGVDEHMGGLGGGHYRAYAHNHVTNKWYHFDDSFVTEARAADSVNSNAYLLFYRRRSSAPLGGKTHQKVEEARRKTKVAEEDAMTVDSQLPTPPSDDSVGYGTASKSKLTATNNGPQSLPGKWIDSPPSAASSPDDPPGFEESQQDELILMSAARYYPESSGRTSPTSSNEAEADPDTDFEIDWPNDRTFNVGVHEVSPSQSPDWNDGINTSSSSLSEMSPFDDANGQKAHSKSPDKHEKTS